MVASLEDGGLDIGYNFPPNCCRGFHSILGGISPMWCRSTILDSLHDDVLFVADFAGPIEMKLHEITNTV